MKLLLVSLVAALAVCQLAAPACAGQRMYLLGGATLASLGGDAAQFGRDLADELTAEVGGDWASEKNSKLGFDVGVGISYAPATGPIGIAGELRLARRGTKFDLTDQAGTYGKTSASINVSYVEIPVLLQISPAGTGAVQPRFVLGPVLGFRAGSEFAVDSPDGSAAVDFDDALKSTYFGGVLGAGVQVRATPTSSFLAEVRMLAGFTNVFEDIVPYEAKAFDFSLLAGWSFGL